MIEHANTELVVDNFVREYISCDTRKRDWKGRLHVGGDERTAVVVVTASYFLSHFLIHSWYIPGTFQQFSRFTLTIDGR